MPEKKTKERANKAKRSGKAASTQAGAYVGEEMRHMKKRKHPVKNRKQAIAIGLSKARRSGISVPAKKRTTKSSRSKSTGSHGSRKRTGRSSRRS